MPETPLPQLIRLLVWGAILLGAGVLLLQAVAAGWLGTGALMNAALGASIVLNLAAVYFFVRYLIAWVRGLSR